MPNELLRWVSPVMQFSRKAATDTEIAGQPIAAGEHELGAECLQHLSAFDFLCVSATMENRVIEFVDHLHEHFLTPVVIRNGHYIMPLEPGYSIEIYPDTLTEYAYPSGKAWLIE